MSKPELKFLPQDDIAADHGKFLVDIATHGRPWRISTAFPLACDFVNRGETLTNLVRAFESYAVKLIADAKAKDMTGVLLAADLSKTLHAMCADLKGEIGGTFERVAEAMREESAA